MKLITISGGYTAVVDDCDYDLLSLFTWSSIIRRDDGLKYAVTKMGKTRILMHRFLLRVFDPRFDVDHVNGDGLDNRKSNLRKCTRQQNLFNCRKKSKASSIYKGVTITKKGKIQASIRVDGRLLYLGYFKTEEAAAMAYNKEALLHRKEFAYLNNIKKYSTNTAA